MDSYTAVVDDVSFDLTQREFEVLRELLLNQGRVLTRQNLLDKLWKYDFYGDERVVDKQGGSGIGLAIVKKIIEDHKGKIWAESVEGEGTTMHINLLKEIGRASCRERV